MKAMLLCAGLGTRLGALGEVRPKPMFPVCDHPILAYGIANLVGHGITDIIINTHHRPEVIRKEIGDGRRYGARVRYIHEETILGTGGGLKHALPLLDPDGKDEPFLSLNGKLIFDLDVSSLVASFRAALAATPDLLSMMVVRKVPDAMAWGPVNVVRDERGPRVANILEDGEHMFCGVHVARPSVIARLPDGEACVLRQGYLPWLRAGARVAAWETPAVTFAEHSTPERYLASNWAMLDGAPLRHPPGKLDGVDPTARIHPTAIITPPVRIGSQALIEANTRVGPYAVVGSRATVPAGTELTHGVIWAGTSDVIR